ncbi:MAG: BlaI/MecI/CopY family transcriptional regulator [Eubacteriales bacterium]|nr:BlaI/MecI/CopY family transcriptional regulator [Eubacteriales bacterium]
MKLFDSELRVMDLLWDRGSMRASDIAKKLGEDIGWNKNTTYTVIKKCLAKGAIERKDPGFICTAKLSREKVQQQETKELIRKLFKNSKRDFLAAFFETEEIGDTDRKELLRFIEEQK